jgi:hypothetical protein
VRLKGAREPLSDRARGHDECVETCLAHGVTGPSDPLVVFGFGDIAVEWVSGDVQRLVVEVGKVFVVHDDLDTGRSDPL